MPNRRSRYQNVQKFYCHYCEQRLWRLGSPKHHLFYQEMTEIKHHLKVSRKSASLLAAQGPCLDQNIWVEEFFCNRHGKMWLRVSKQADGTLTSAPATEQDWKQTNGTSNPSQGNPSVSEFTQRMSRRASIHEVAYGLG